MNIFLLIIWVGILIESCVSQNKSKLKFNAILGSIMAIAQYVNIIIK